MRRSGFLFTLSLLSLVLFVSGCGSSGANADSSGASPDSGDKPATISFWYLGNDADPNDHYAQWMKENLAEFAKQYPNIKVDATTVSGTDLLLQKISTAMAGNSAPDLFQGWLSGRLEPFVDSDRVLALDDMIANNPDLQETVNPNNLATATFDGKVYGLPLISISEVMFYNKKIFKENGLSVPTTYDEFLNVVKTLKSKGITPIALGNQDPWTGTILYMSLYQRIAGPDKWKEAIVDHTGKFTDPEYVEAGNKLQEIVKAGAFPENFNSLSYGEAETMFDTGKAAMYMMGSWAIPFDTLGDDAGFFNFPDISGGKGSAKDDWIVNQDTSYSVSKNTKNPEAVSKLLGFIFSKARLKEYAETGALLAAKNVDYDSTKVPALTNEISKVIGEAKHQMLPWDVPAGVTVGNQLNLATQSIYAGQKPEEALGNLQKIADQEWGN